ncbi:MAG TPA: ribosome assembly cofactor RimP [Bacteroidales bacterium]|nr:ribosome assembly cofactor RimP [Bacteroidales bacterium]HCI55643.1 ribosome assembly cofactor RimP [Bacteroidales bacterium]HOU95845.1 ribosome assembly cofactor RimP [Bacteroidales bacterium]HQG37225.1 ribosome assembly cofactor RimP [Bacteroidales bacterium]HQG52618.1 ribosome assembly cofactor RimP [Bacteroidales bacterium]
MVDKKKIEEIVRQYINGTNIFLVDIKVNQRNEITVFADTREGITIEQCADLNLYLERNLNRDEEDFELQVSSPGIGTPFRVREQYLKNKGKTVEVIDYDNNRYTGILYNINNNGFELEWNPKQTGKRKFESDEIKYLSFNFDNIKSVKELIGLR